MKRLIPTTLPPASLLVKAIVEEEALLAELVAASRAGKPDDVLAVSEKITALRTAQEAFTDKLLQSR